MTTLKVGIADYEEMKARTMRIASGEENPAPGDPKVRSECAKSLERWDGRCARIEPRPRPDPPSIRAPRLRTATRLTEGRSPESTIPEPPSHSGCVIRET